MTFYKNRYRIESTRLKEWDYSSRGYYYITICTKNREMLFGNVVNGKIVLSEIGKTVDSEWLKSFEIRPELLCDEYCIMPNHIHGIVFINGNNENDANTHNNENNVNDRNDGIVRNNVNDRDDVNKTNPAVKTDGTIIKRVPRSISSFIAGFKSSATKRINELRQTPRKPVWQPRFYDHIIRDDHDLQRIRKYIRNNPINW